MQTRYNVAKWYNPIFFKTCDPSRFYHASKLYYFYDKRSESLKLKESYIVHMFPIDEDFYKLLNKIKPFLILENKSLIGGKV